LMVNVDQPYILRRQTKRKRFEKVPHCGYVRI
jgi:hypothetical protein